MTTPDDMPVPPDVSSDTWSPTPGERIVLVYPPAWNLDNRYGTVNKLNPDGTYYMVDAKTEQVILVDPRRNEEHGATVRRLIAKERYPTGRKKKTPKRGKG